MSSVVWKIVDTPYYQRALKRFLKKHPDLRRAYDDGIHLLAANPHDSSLKLHPLGGKYASEYAVCITYGYRIVLTLAVIERQIVLLDVGSHDDVYRQ
jgi:mRNA-degrading endonuclease YafQ of YafQ-DinJ toxin-antitoxin module